LADLPADRGVRAEWSRLPAESLAALEEWLGARVVAAEPQTGGFSPGVAARVRAADGRRVFVKAAGPELNPDTPGIYRQERRIVAALPPSAPAPRLLWSHDAGDGGWVLLVFEDVEGRQPAQPWREDELDRVLAALADLADELTPSPVAAPPAADFFAERMNGFQRLVAEPLPGLDEWSQRHLERLAEVESRAPALVGGDTLVHLDVRADNILLTPERVVFVDWPEAAVGARWIDPIFFTASVTLAGGPEPEELLRRYCGAEAADENALVAAIVATAGYFTQRSLLPPAPGLPTLRPFQAAQGAIARRWVAKRTGWR
jgi:Ser/Thr protein kinase RdoA (MazF antagonist)